MKARTLPTWYGDAEQVIIRLLSLPPDWDSYGASKVRPAAVKAALSLLALAGECQLPQPEIVPTSTGGVQVEWHHGGRDLEIETDGARRYRVFFQEESCESIEVETENPREYLDRLSR